MSAPWLRPVALGTTAHAAAASARGVGRVLARLGAATYLTLDGQIAWLGSAGAPLHPRAILAAAPRADDEVVRLDIDGLVPWRPPVPGPVTAQDLAPGWREAAASLATPRGFGTLLAGEPPAFPLDGARGAAEALARACATGDAATAAEAALALLGHGGGLTPSGDDYVGGALFVRALIAAGPHHDPPAWRGVAERVLDAAPARTHPISAALLGDLAAGLSWAPLHELIGALAAGTPEAARAAARRLVALGHTSGWDMLAGVGAGLGALVV